MIEEGFVIAIFFVVFYTLLLSRKREKSFPPGPYSFPILGNLLQIGLEPYNAVMSMRKKYGDIIAIDLGMRKAIFINECKLLKQAFNISTFNGRNRMRHFAEDTGEFRGIIFNSGPNWVEQRRFVMAYIQSGIRNGTTMETLVMNEVRDAVKTLLKIVDTPKDTQHIFSIYAGNALWTIVTGERCSPDDPEFQKLIKVNTAVQTSILVQGLLVFYPTFSSMFPKLTGYYKIRNYMKNMQSYMENIVNNHKKTYTQGIQRDLVDYYLEKIYSTTDIHSQFYGNTGERNLVYCLVELFMAGTETVSTFLHWLLFLLAHHPEIQDKAHRIIVQHFGNSNWPTLKDKASLPYIEALIQEVLRYAGMQPLGAFHETLDNVDFNGYKIPKGTIVVANQYGILHDPLVWGDPENFRPERFLDENGANIGRHPAFVPFGIGRRVCPGESFAMDELFLFTTSLLHNLAFEFDPSLKKPKMTYILGNALLPVKHKIIFRTR